MKTIGIAAIALGLAALGYNLYLYAWPEEVASIGKMSISVARHETLPMPLILGGISVAVGVALLLFRSKKAAA